jgi:hypothetical protein
VRILGDKGADALPHRRAELVAAAANQFPELLSLGPNPVGGIDRH